MKLDKNLTAPLFKLVDVFGREIDLNNYKEKKVLIAFFRHAGCPFCNIRVHTLKKVQPELREKGLEMIFFFESKTDVILRSTFHQEVNPIPIISDPQKIWYNTYGLETSGLKASISILSSFVQTSFKAKSVGAPNHLMADGESISTMPAEFLLDKDLVIKKVLYSQRLNERMDLKEIKEFADKESPATNRIAS